VELRPKSFWTPRYIRDRLELAYHQNQHPDVPWLCRTAVDLLPGLLRETDRMLEWGSGRSTKWFTARVASLQSIEHDRAWFDRVLTDLGQHGLDPNTVRHLSAAPEEDPHASPYVRVVDELQDGSIDVCLVDGHHRHACALAILPKLASGALVIIDDAHWFFDRPTTSPHSRVGKGTLPGDWTTFEQSVSGWRCGWTSDGVTDTAFWVKP
jgi:predicted O-methyltransferase YrrM